jgi:hypothetical protein
MILVADYNLFTIGVVWIQTHAEEMAFFGREADSPSRIGNQTFDMYFYFHCR